MQRILLIDDNEEYCEQVKKTLQLREFELVYFTDGSDGLNHVLHEDWEAVLLDVYLNQEIDGLHILKEIVRKKPELPIIMVSGRSTLQTAVAATKMGAYDFLEKPIDMDRLLLTIERAVEKNKLTSLTNQLRKELDKNITLIGNSKDIRKVYDDVLRVAPTNTKILIQGESGVGKDLVARLVHYHSERGGNPYVAINCAAVPENLVETELFGYARGAFTGAEQDTPGKIEAAGNGTLFLDEIAELPLASQAKLLHFLQSGEYSRLGSANKQLSNARVIAATNKNLQHAIENNLFRQDLFYRLNVVNIHIPPLRERREDIPELAKYFLGQACQKFGKKITHFSEEALSMITDNSWPGNVRQLKSAVYRMVLFCNHSMVDYGVAATAIQMDRSNELIISGDSYEDSMKEFEKLYFLNKLNLYNDDLDGAARASGLSRETFLRKLRELGLPTEGLLRKISV
ncbi:MAG: response regulator [Caldithrix sp.]|nr:response regulator [Caldithrix sp.]